MTLLQLWLLVGVPCLALATAMFVGRSRWRSLLGYAALLVGFGVMVFFDRASAAVFGGLLALVYASGRGGDIEREYDLASATGVGAAEAAERSRTADTVRRPAEPEEATPAASG